MLNIEDKSLIEGILYIVIPCYNEEEVLPATNSKLVHLLREMSGKHIISLSSKILYVENGSQDNTWDIIKRFHEEDDIVCSVKLTPNAGHQGGLMAGLTVAKEYADIMITIDADLQDDINVIPQMIEDYNNGCDIVYGVRKARNSDTFFKRNTALAFYKIMKSLGVDSVYNHADFRLMSKRTVEQLCKYPERNLFLRGIVPMLGYKTSNVYYDRAERTAGESKYPLSAMVNFAIDGITSFSVKPVRLVFFSGLIFIVISIFILGYVLYSYFVNDIAPGWASLILSLWFIGGCILAGIGIIGEYIGKIYLEVKQRPRYNIETIIL